MMLIQGMSELPLPSLELASSLPCSPFQGLAISHLWRAYGPGIIHVQLKEEQFFRLYFEIEVLETLQHHGDPV